jgi:hypothetical protein
VTSSDAFVWWRSHARDRPPGGIPWLEIGEDSFQETERRITGRNRLPGPVPDWADDLFRTARAAFLADKYLRRGDADDRWTRHIHMSVPVTDPDRWNAPAARGSLVALLETMTSDIWDVEYRGLTQQVQEALCDPGAECASDITLFSGGLDSLSWAAKCARTDTARPLLLVMFREIGLLRRQRQVYASVKRIAKSRAVLQLPMSQTPVGDGSKKRLETSSRTRGLLYVAGAIRAATAHGATTVHVPENGQLALNPPLTPARSGACSTRSVHPWTLHLLNGLVAAVSGDEGPVEVVNPLAHLTKGEVCRSARTAGLRRTELEATLSCGRPPARRSGGPPLANCGTCFPCLVRRSSLLHANGADRTPYEASPWTEGPQSHRAEDWRALQRWLHRPYTMADLLADTPLPPGTDLRAVLDVLTKGREELSRLLSAAEVADLEPDSALAS